MANGFNPLTNLAQGLSLRNQMQDREQQNRLNQLRATIGQQASQGGFNPAQSLEFQQLAALDPTGAAKSLATFNALDQTRQGAMFQDAREARRMLESGNDEGFLNLVGNRLQAVEQLNGDPSDTQFILNQYAQGDRQGVLQSLSNMEQAGIELGYLKAPEKKKGEKVTANIADFLFLEELRKQGKEEEAAAFANKSGLSRLSPEEQAELNAKSAGMQQREKDKAKTLSGYVNDGVGAADGVATIKRSLQLLDTVKTGGIDALKLWASQKFGIEGADEGELSNLMGKAVLSQLKATFGAAFTANEVNMLTNLEQSFGRNAETNKRLLRNALKISERASKRGIRAAKELGNDFAANEIKLALEQGLDELPQQPKPEVNKNSIQVGRFTVQEQ